MTRHSDQARLRHMLDHASEAVGLVKGRTREDLDTDRLLNLSLVRLLEIVGEAAARLSPETRNGSPHIPWPDIITHRAPAGVPNLEPLTRRVLALHARCYQTRGSHDQHWQHKREVGDDAPRLIHRQRQRVVNGPLANQVLPASLRVLSLA